MMDWSGLLKKVIGNIVGKSVLCLALVVGFVSATRAQNDAEKLYKAKCIGCHAADGSEHESGKKYGRARPPFTRCTERNRRHIDRDRNEGQEKDA